jgi:hypothetical protein
MAWWLGSKMQFTACSLGLIWLAESTAGWFFMREKHYWLAD